MDLKLIIEVITILGSVAASVTALIGAFWWFVRRFNKSKLEEIELLKEKNALLREKAEKLAFKNNELFDDMRKTQENQKQAGDKAAKYGDIVGKYNELVRKHNNLVQYGRTLKKQVASLNEQAKLTEKLQGQLWDLAIDGAAIAPFRPLGPGKAVIIAVINLKGGVGKTTLAANLAVTYARYKNKRVLAVDLDFQASLTNLCLASDDAAKLMVGDGRLVDNVFTDRSPGLANRAFNNVAQTREPMLHLLANSERLARIEEEAKAQWIMNHAGLDLRCILRAALHDSLFQDNFDVILIDCPPRWTTGSINAIACCDYVLIPTQLDRVSSEAVPRLLGWLRNLRQSSHDLYGHFNVLGVLGNLAFPREKLIATEQAIWDDLKKKSNAAWNAGVYPFGTIIRDKALFRRAANKRAFAALDPDLQPAFLQLVNEIEARRAEHEGR